VTACLAVKNFKQRKDKKLSRE